jgi:hypothetical protein
MRLLQLGFGTVGKENIRQLLRRGHEVVAVVSRNSDRIDLDGFDFKGARPIIGNNLAECIAKSGADLILQATAFDPEDMIHVAEQAAAGGCDIITANPIVDVRDTMPELFGTLDGIARKGNIRILGAGVIPGLYSDMLPLLMTGACAEVSCVRFRRRADFSKWGTATLTAFGFATRPEEFERRIADGSITLFRALSQSACLIARELGWPIDTREEIKTPQVSGRDRRTPYIQAPAGTVGGFSHRVVLRSTRGRSVDLEVSGIIDPLGEDEQLQMSVEIEGNPQIKVDLHGEILMSAGSVIGTSARMLNSIDPLRAGKPGFRTTADLPLVSFAGLR